MMIIMKSSLRKGYKLIGQQYENQMVILQQTKT